MPGTGPKTASAGVSAAHNAAMVNGRSTTRPGPTEDRYYGAFLAHDARFDGRFFVAVSSTRIYCRPVCTVKPPKRENCRFFPSAAAAEALGYRPCLSATVVAAIDAHAVRWLRLVALRAFAQPDGGERIVRPALGRARLGMASFGIRHRSSLLRDGLMRPRAAIDRMARARWSMFP